MKKIIFTRGLPHSGKNEWAERFCHDNFGYININKDHIMKVLSITKPLSKLDEYHINSFKNHLINFGITMRFSIVISDTNLADSEIQEVFKLVKDYGYHAEIKDFPIDKGNLPLVESIENEICRYHDSSDIYKLSINHEYSKWNPIEKIIPDNN